MRYDERGVLDGVTRTLILSDGLTPIRCVRLGSSTSLMPLRTSWSSAGVSGRVTGKAFDTEFDSYWRLVVSCKADDRRAMDMI